MIIAPAFLRLWEAAETCEGQFKYMLDQADGDGDRIEYVGVVNECQSRMMELRTALSELRETKGNAMTPNEMSLDQARDWLSIDEQDKILAAMGSKATTEDYYKVGPVFPPTLDGAAGAMPEGWTWAKGYTVSVGMGAPPSGVAWSAKFVGDYARLSASVWSTGNEILDRYRLAVACRMAMKGTP